MADVHLEALYKVLKSSKDVFWFENKHLSEKEKQAEWTKRFEDLANRLGASSNPLDDEDGTGRDPKSPKRMARSVSSDQPLSKRRTTDSTNNQPIELQRHASIAGTPVRAKDMTEGSWAAHPFVYPPARQSLPSSYPYPATPVTTPLTTHHTPSPQSLSSPHELNQPTFVPCLQNMSVDEYVASLPRHEPHSSSPQCSYGTGKDSSAQSPSVQPSPSTNPDLCCHEQVDTVYSAASVAMTRATTLASEPLSRTTTDQMICSPMDALHVASSDSAEEYTAFSAIVGDTRKMNDVSSPFFSADFPTDTLFLSSNPLLSPVSSLSPVSLSTGPSFPSSVPMAHSLSQLSNESSASSSSSSSNLSSRSRATRRTQEQIVQGTRPIAPKAKKTSVTGTPLIRVPLANGNSKEVAQIPKADSPRRPARQRTFCDRCNDHPEGFHGEHELRRHIERLHTTVRRVWVCKDNSPDGKFLANCKACRSGKTYGANYNAAAHLRRTHFHPCKKGRGGRGKPSEKRGGKGGGDDPPMEVLKDWMYQKEELVPIDDVNHSLMLPQTAEDDELAEVDSSSDAEDDDLTDHQAPSPSFSRHPPTAYTFTAIVDPALDATSAIPRQCAAAALRVPATVISTVNSAYTLPSEAPASTLYSACVSPPMPITFD